MQRIAAYLGFTAALVLSLNACANKPLNTSCTKDSECGSGYDCYKQVCVQVCTKDKQCPSATTCQKYRCLAENNARGKTSARAAKTTAPEAPKQDLVEKQALRREFELIRQNQIKMQQTLKEIRNELKALQK